MKMSFVKRGVKRERDENNSLVSTKSPDINSNNERHENLDENTGRENNNQVSDEQLESDQQNHEKDKVQIDFNNASGENRCNHCRQNFENPIMLLRHKREVHSFPKTVLPIEEIEKYYDHPNRSFCPICKKVIKTNNYRSVFLKHLHTHTVLVVFECVICKQKFRRKDHMLNHQRRHIVPIEDFIGQKKVKS